jgi:hypothetical protein
VILGNDRDSGYRGREGPYESGQNQPLEVDQIRREGADTVDEATRPAPDLAAAREANEGVPPLPDKLALYTIDLAVSVAPGRVDYRDPRSGPMSSRCRATEVTPHARREHVGGTAEWIEVHAHDRHAGTEALRKFHVAKAHTSRAARQRNFRIRRKAPGV